MLRAMFLKWLQVSVVSVVYSQSDLLQKEVFLVELINSISKSKESMSHLKAVYFLRPTTENIQHLRQQLASPRFGEYHLCKVLEISLEYQIAIALSFYRNLVIIFPGFVIFVVIFFH